MVEFALVMPVLMLLLFGIIDFGSVYSNMVSIRQGVREGARQGVIARWGSACSLNAMDITPSSDIQKLMCTVKNRIGITPTSSVYVKVLFDSSYAADNGLVVCAMTPTKSLSGYLTNVFAGDYIKTKVEMNIETASGSETAGEETAPSGQSWSWCTATSNTP